MSPRVARYDGHAEWYDETFSAYATGEEAEFLRGQLGAGRGQVCVDLACGSGLFGPVMRSAGYSPLGFDISADQLRLANGRLAAIALADVCQLPLPDESVDFVVGTYFHTDTENFPAAVHEAARILRPQGQFVYVGLHPCFIGPFVDRTTEHDEHRLSFVEGYGQLGWAMQSSGGGVGLWSRVGGHHKTLTAFLGAFTAAGLILLELEEFAGGGVVLPRNIGVVVEKPATTAPLRLNTS